MKNYILQQTNQWLGHILDYEKGCDRLEGAVTHQIDPKVRFFYHLSLSILYTFLILECQA